MNSTSQTQTGATIRVRIVLDATNGTFRADPPQVMPICGATVMLCIDNLPPGATPGLQFVAFSPEPGTRGRIRLSRTGGSIGWNLESGDSCLRPTFDLTRIADSCPQLPRIVERGPFRRIRTRDDGCIVAEGFTGIQGYYEYRVSLLDAAGTLTTVPPVSTTGVKPVCPPPDPD